METYKHEFHTPTRHTLRNYIIMKEIVENGKLADEIGIELDELECFLGDRTKSGQGQYVFSEKSLFSVIVWWKNVPYPVRTEAARLSFL